MIIDIIQTDGIKVREITTKRRHIQQRSSRKTRWRPRRGADRGQTPRKP